MPEIIPAQPVPAAGSPGASANGVPRGAPQAPAPGIVPPVQSIAPVESPEVRAANAKFAEERRVYDRKMALQQKKYREEAISKEKTWGEKLSKLSEYEKQDAQAKLNKSAYLEAKFGKDWYDQIVQEKLNGGAPTGDVIASEIAKVREEFEARLAAKDAEHAKAQQAAQQKSVESARRQLAAEGANFWKANGKEFPVLENLGSETQIAALLSQRIESRYNSTVQRDDSGQVLMDGKIITMKEAAEELEAEILAITEKAVKHEKYAARFAPQPKPPGVVGGPILQQPRRTLTNDLTASTSGRAAPVSDAERRERAVNAFNALRAKQP